MFDIGFTELLVIGVVALVVVGPERLPKVARTAGHLYGRMQRYVSTVKSDISREMQAEELRRVGQEFRESVKSVAGNVEQQASVVDDYLRNEASNIGKVMSAMAVTERERPAPDAAKSATIERETAQQALPLDEPDQNPAPAEPASGKQA
ncbi:MAG: Sec-independent protein translocase protein TatB [Pseudomonadota bacterium]